METGYSHVHDFMELTFVVSGIGRYQINGRSYDVNTGDLIFINPGDSHRSIVTDAASPLVLFAVGFTDFEFSNMEPNHLQFPIDSPIFRTDADFRQTILQLCYAMLEEQEHRLPGTYDMIRAYLTQLVLLIHRNVIHSSDSKEGCHFASYGKSYVVKTIMAYMNEHYAEKISLDQIAQNIYLSPVYISRVFKEETGDSPINHLIQIRLEKAKNLLIENPSLSIKTIAQQVGYDDAYHFSKLFKKHFGVAPTFYKQNNFS